MSNEQIEAAAKTLSACMDYPWEHMPEQGRNNMRKHAKAVIEAAGIATHAGAAAAEPSDTVLLNLWDRVSHVSEMGVRRLAFARAVLALTSAPAVPEAVLMPRELAVRVAERLRKAQIFQLSGEVEAVLKGVQPGERGEGR